MKKINIFDKKYINLFCYQGDGIEFIHSIMFSIGYRYNELSSEIAKKNTLFVIEELLNLDLLFVFHWGEEDKSMKKRKMSTKEIVDYIDSVWFEGADLPDFYGMFIFGHKKWYTEKLEKLGMTNTTNWEKFVKKEIADLEKWIKTNKPKE